MRRILLALVLALLGTAGHAQGCGPQNPNCIVPTAPFGTSNNQAASTEFVQGAVSAVTITGQPLTKTDDTNVTVTFGGAPATALLQPTSITMGWAGTLAAGRLNANVVQSVVNDTNVTGSISSQTLTLGWQSTLSVARGGTGLASTTANQLLYSSATNTIAGLATANRGVLSTDASGVPSITAQPTLGVNGGTGGQIVLNGATSGSVTTRVAAAAGTGTIFQYPSTNGSNGQALLGDGTGVLSYAPEALPRIIGQSAVASSVTGTTAETTLATITVPAGMLGANGKVRIETWWTTTNNANAKTFLVRFNGTSGTAYLNSSPPINTVSSRVLTEIANRNATNSQIGNPTTFVSYGLGSTVAFTTSAVDTTAAVDISVRGTLANAADTITLEAYQVIVYPKP
jgi:hypothetical protein